VPLDGKRLIVLDTIHADNGPASLPADLDAWGMAVAGYALLSRFGFGRPEPADADAGMKGDWTLVLPDPAGELFARCDLSGRSLRCETGR